MKLIVGLGNPGPRYETTRHNAGFLLLDELADHFQITGFEEKFHGLIAKGAILGQQCLLLKPMTFMNKSGISVREAKTFFKVQPTDIVVLYDDIDLQSGVVKARAGGGHGGHNGVRSMMDEMGSGDFHRVKIGVGRPQEPGRSVSDWVLSPFSDPELLEIQEKMLKEVLLRLENIFKN
ncbi:MAG: aminoacyl-tRNA hydrolase [Oligoflexales bacterium]